MAAGDTITVTRIRPPGKDRFGDPLPGTPTELDVEGCLFEPGPSREYNAASNQVDTDATIYAPAGTDVVDTDQIRARGQVYGVVGDPKDWGSFGIEIRLRKVKG